MSLLRMWAMNKSCLQVLFCTSILRINPEYTSQVSSAKPTNGLGGWIEGGDGQAVFWGQDQAP